MTVQINPDSQIGLKLAQQLGLELPKREGHDLAGPCIDCKSSDAFRLHQQSGVAHDSENIFALPRFALNESYGDIDRFKLISRTLALPVSDVTPSDSLLGPNPPLIGFTVAEGLERV